MKSFFSDLMARVRTPGRPRRPSDRSRRFVPLLEALEDRCLPSVFIPHGPPTPSRVGGAAALVGDVLTVDLRNLVNQPALINLTIVDDGHGDVAVEWNGVNVHSFTGVRDIVVNTAPTVTERVTFDLTGPLTAPLNVQLNLGGINNTVTEHGVGLVPPSGLTFDIVTLRPNGTTQVTGL
jgi:hypothetical protein